MGILNYRTAEVGSAFFFDAGSGVEQGGFKKCTDFCPEKSRKYRFSESDFRICDDGAR